MDRSTKGSYDEDIIKLLELVNSKEGYKTTSSCSGRITMVSSLKKSTSYWLFKKHDAASADEVYGIVKGLKEPVWFLQEPLILHVRCNSLEDAGRLLELALKLGLKHSGLISLKGMMVELRSHERVELPIDASFSKEQVALIVGEANKKLLQTKRKIQLLEEAFSKDFP